MGNNYAYTIFEETIISIYDAGALTKELLTALMEVHRGTDIDSGGSQDLIAKDGKNLEQIVIEIWGLDMPPAPPSDAADDALDGHESAIYDLFKSITDQFDWW